MKISVVGFGNIGAAIAAESVRQGHQTTIINSRQNQTNYNLTVTRNGQEEPRSIDRLTTDYEEGLFGAEVVYLTHPSFMLEETLHHIRAYLPINALVVFVPGGGGKIYSMNNMASWVNDCLFLERVPMISRLDKLKQTLHYELKSEIRYYLKAYNGRSSAKVVELFPTIQMTSLHNSVQLELITSNSILHPSRLLDLFEDTDNFDQVPLFYEQWTERASHYLFQLSAEVNAIVDRLPAVAQQDYVSITEHYGVTTESNLGQKIRSIESFKGIAAPVVPDLKTPNLYHADFKSRYFTEDIPYGLINLKGLALILGVETPMMNKILYWAESKMNKHYLTVDGGLGSDVLETGAPQRYGISTTTDFYQFFDLK